MGTKVYTDQNVYDAAAERVSYAFDNFDKLLVGFSGGKDSSVLMHIVCAEARRRNRVVGVMLVDFEAQYEATSDHAMEMFEEYKDNLDIHWICLPMALRNAASNFEPSWTCWDEEKKNDWVRPMPDHPSVINGLDHYPFFHNGMEFEEFVVLFAQWYSGGAQLGVFVGIRCDESLNRFRTIVNKDKETFNGKRWTTKIVDECYNLYPIYDWATKDIWAFHGKNPDACHNKIYDLMHLAGVKPSQQRLCQPYGDDQRRGLWLYHILEPQTWCKVVARVNGVNSMAASVMESGNISGNRKITLPAGHTWKSFSCLLLATLPGPTRSHYMDRFKVFIAGWHGRGYQDGIPDFAPRELENAHWAPSWRRICRVLLRNDWWCKGLGLTQPKSAAYGVYLEIKKERKGQK